MLTIKQITESTETVICGLEKKHFKGAKDAIEKAIELNEKRKGTQVILDNNLAEANKLAKSIGMFMKEGRKDEADKAKARRNLGINEENDLFWGNIQGFIELQKDLINYL